MSSTAAAAAPPAARPAGRARLGPGLVLLLLALAVLLPLVGLPGRWLWLDELLSANFAAHGPWATLVTVLRFDVHPPLYYLQLSFWMLLGGRGDAWLMANSILWHAAAVLLLALGAARFHGARVGLAAGLLLALSPAALAYADQVRMYAFLVFLLVWAWYAQARWLEGTAGRLGALWMVASQAAVTASHTAGLLMLSGLVVLGAATVLAQGRKGLVLRWLAIEATVGLLSLPSVAIGAMRGVSHLVAPGVEEILATWSFLAGGGGAALGPAASAALGLAVLAVLALGCLRDRRLVLPVLALVFVPLLLAGLASHLARPVWIERIFLPVLPFLCLCLARAALGGVVGEEAPRRAAGVGAAAAAALLGVRVLAWGGAGLAGQFTREKGDGFRPAAELVRERARPGDLVLVEGDFAYWCFLWYFAGPDWGQPRHAFILNPEWERLMRRLPASVPALLGLRDTADAVRRVDGGATVALWDRRRPPPAPPAEEGDVFLLHLPQTPPPPDLPGRRLAERAAVVQLGLERWSRAP